MHQHFKELIYNLYPQHTEHIINQTQAQLGNTTPAANQPAFWYKRIQLYVTYADSFEDDGKANFFTLADHLDEINNLGCNAIHVLPFLESPRIDGGFDVSHFKSVPAALGGIEGVDHFLKEAINRNITPFMDLVLNHVSDQHRWFQQAQEGEATFRDYFIWTNEKPKLLNLQDGHATYEVFGNTVDIPIIFSKNQAELPHWRQGEDGNWYFHTFFPSQLDLNWDNPNVFLEFMRIIHFWSQKGFHFRIDAAPHLDKRFIDTVEKGTPRTHQIIQALHQVTKACDPDTALIVEVVDSVEAITSYLKNQSGSIESEIAYNLVTLNGLWAAVVLENAKPLWQALDTTESLPHHAQWINFLRSHDALMLGFLKSNAPQQVHEILKERGTEFEGIQIAGRTATLLKKDPKRIILAHALLASLPGIPALYYGDEYGKPSDRKWMREHQKETGLKDPDTRQLGRGRVTPEQRTAGQSIYQAIAEIYSARSHYLSLASTKPIPIESEPFIFACQYEFGHAIIHIYLNLSRKDTATVHVARNVRPILAINHPKLENQTITLPPNSGVWLTARPIKNVK